MLTAALSNTIGLNIQNFFVKICALGNYKAFQQGTLVCCYTAINSASMNIIFKFHDTTAHDLNEAIDFFQHKKVPFRYIGDATGMQQTLTSRGLNLLTTANLMAYDLSNTLPMTTNLINIKRVSNQQELQDFSLVAGQNFQWPAQSWFTFFNNINTLFTSSMIRLYVAYMDNKPVATTALFIDQDIAGNYYWAVNKEFRQQQLASYMVNAMLKVAQEEGLSVAVAQCFPTSTNLAKRIGFKSYGSLDVYGAMQCL